MREGHLVVSTRAASRPEMQVRGAEQRLSPLEEGEKRSKLRHWYQTYLGRPPGAARGRIGHRGGVTAARGLGLGGS